MSRAHEFWRPASDVFHDGADAAAVGGVGATGCSKGAQKSIVQVDDGGFPLRAGN